MSDPKDRAYLLDMREFATQVLHYLEGKKHEELTVQGFAFRGIRNTKLATCTELK